jgi:hypothetical protein
VLVEIANKMGLQKNYIPEDRSLHSHNFENLKSNKMTVAAKETRTEDISNEHETDGETGMGGTSC